LAIQSEIKEDVALLTSIPGIGQQTALMILTLLPEIGSLENKSLAALVGVAPFNRDSGQLRGKRFIQGERKTVRKALYMAAVAAVRWNKPLADFYHGLRAKGKCGKVAIVAVMNKLLAVASSVYKRKSEWVENLV
jgi:transposase